MMPDPRKVHLLAERDPVSDYPDSFVRVMLLHGQLWGEGYRDGPSWWQTDGDVEAGTPDAWTPLPTATDLTVEDVRELIVMAETKAYDLLFEASESFDSDVVRDFTAFGKKTLAAVAKVKAALGGGVS